MFSRNEKKGVKTKSKYAVVMFSGSKNQLQRATLDILSIVLWTPYFPILLDESSRRVTCVVIGSGPISYAIILVYCYFCVLVKVAVSSL